MQIFNHKTELKCIICSDCCTVCSKDKKGELKDKERVKWECVLRGKGVNKSVDDSDATQCNK